MSLSSCTAILENLNLLLSRHFWKPTLDSGDLNKYHLNLSFLSKLVEGIITNHLQTHLSSHNLLPKFQAAYRKFHISETVLLYV